MEDVEFSWFDEMGSLPLEYYRDRKKYVVSLFDVSKLPHLATL